MLILEGLVDLHRTVQLQLLQHDLDYCDTEWFALEMNRDHSVIFEIAPNYCILAIYTEELYKKDLNDSDNHDCVITYLEPDILKTKSSGP